ncbi:hypothetical protein E2C01_076847 [Portunus trituberculatus]|uniref:Uncharacterized protein n=1 Tax=Portunus trituberculatus TaxID=210409 RepID=A0A5B7IJN1_PORTR|nr:hypothetical protein [Portunus trituberculatus]
MLGHHGASVLQECCLQLFGCCFVVPRIIISSVFSY